MKPIVVRGARVVDPAAGRDEVADVLLQDGTSLIGLISFVRPPDRSRLVDVLNETPPFFRLLQGDLVAYVNKAHVARVALRGGR